MLLSKVRFIERLITELSYLPPIESFAYFKQAEVVMLEAHENYQKNSYRNRTHIAGANGLQRLSIPLSKGKHQQQAIREVSMSQTDNWPKQHWQSIRSAYGNAPFFEFYADELAPLFARSYELLWDFNLDILRQLFQLLQWEDKLFFTESYQKTYPAEVVDIRHQIRPKGTNENALTFPTYPQVFTERHGFLPNLSILDLLFCQGPQANLYLSRLSIQS